MTPHPVDVEATVPHSQGDYSAALEVSDLVVMGSRQTRAIDGITFVVQPGEIFGIAGVEGNGQTGRSRQLLVCGSLSPDKSVSRVAT